jgi:hypothetical protein
MSNIKFDTTKLSTSRIRLLASITNSPDGSHVNTEVWDREAFSGAAVIIHIDCAFEVNWSRFAWRS